jgi:hypothetical protein
MDGYIVRCQNPSCGHEWLSHSVSGVTRCGECRARVYVPVDQRPRRYVDEQRARRRGYGGAANSRPARRRERRRDPDEYNANDSVSDRNDRARPAKERREVARSRPSPAGQPPLTTALTSLLARHATARPPPPVQAPAPRTRRTAPQTQTAAGVPPPKRTRAVLACGHVVVLGGAPESWYGVAAPCPTCRRDVNVSSTEPALGYRANKDGVIASD